MSRRWLSAALITAALYLTPAPSEGAFHVAVIDEVLTSSGGDDTVQFVEIRMLAVGQGVVNNSEMGVFDTSGAYIGKVLDVTANVPNDANGSRWLMGSAQFATVTGLTPDFTFNGPVFLPTTGGMVCWGKPFNPTMPSQYVDCVAYGTYSGPVPFFVGTPTALDGIGHSLQRVSVTNNNSNDFTCGDPSTPTNNSPASVNLPASAPCPPTPTPTVTNTPTISPTPTETPTPTPIVNDAVVLPLKPVSVKIAAMPMPPPVIKKIKVGVRNGNAAGAGPVPIKLTATTCGGATVTVPDFDTMTAGFQDTVVLASGKSKKATVLVTIPSSGFTSFNEKSPERCQLTFQADVDIPGNTEPRPANNIAKLELNVLDKNDPIGSAPATMNHESVAVSEKPLSVKIREGSTNLIKTFKLKVTNTDIEADPGHAITVTLGAGTCIGVGLPDFSDTVGVQNSVTVEGEKSATGVVTLTLSRDDYLSPNKNTPARCTQQFCQTGPMGNVEPNTTNDCTELLLDVKDENDF